MSLWHQYKRTDVGGYIECSRVTSGGAEWGGVIASLEYVRNYMDFNMRGKVVRPKTIKLRSGNRVSGPSQSEGVKPKSFDNQRDL